VTSFPWLSLIVFLPLAGALLCLLVKAESARWLALGVTVADFALSLPLWWLFDSSTAGMQFVEHDLLDQLSTGAIQPRS
jgi:NADH-quinone oxidoreductase subunit M